MESLTDAEFTLLERFAEQLSKPGMPVRVEYTPPPSPHVTVHFKKLGQNDGHRDLVLSAYPTLGQLKAAIKKEAGVV
jgi:hypothetical protein